MPTEKRPITFYADEEITAWYESLPQGRGSRLICEAIKAGLKTQKQSHADLQEVVLTIMELDRRLAEIERTNVSTAQKLPTSKTTGLTPIQGGFCIQSLPSFQGVRPSPSQNGFSSAGFLAPSQDVRSVFGTPLTSLASPGGPPVVYSASSDYTTPKLTFSASVPPAPGAPNPTLGLSTPSAPESASTNDALPPPGSATGLALWRLLIQDDAK
jgi:hypothetical protein